MSKTFTVGFAGIGMMGAPMVACLAAAGWPVRIHDPRAAALAPFAGPDGVTAAGSLAQAAAGPCRAVTVPPDGKACRRAGATTPLCRTGVRPSTSLYSPPLRTGSKRQRDPERSPARPQPWPICWQA